MLDLHDSVADPHHDARRRAHALAEEGRFREAVAIGQAADRQERQPAFERDLRDWRHRGYFEIEAGIGRADWPPEADDPRADLIDRIPEIHADELTAAVLAGALRHHGSLIVRGLISPMQAERYVAAIDEAFDARDAEQGSAFQPLTPVNGRNLVLERAFGGPTTVLMADAPEFLAVWVDELQKCGVLDVVTEHLGERPALSANKANLYRIPPKPGTQWHQDGAFLGADIRTVNLWVACTDCGIDAPGLEIIPWRVDKIVEIGTHGSRFEWSVGEGFAKDLAGDRATAIPHFGPGDAILFDQLCLHRTGVPANATRGRYAIETWMFAPSQYRDGVPLFI